MQNKYENFSFIGRISNGILYKYIEIDYGQLVCFKKSVKEFIS